MKALVRRYQLTSFFVLTFAIMYGTLFGLVWLSPGQPLVPWSIIWFVSVFSPTIAATTVSWMIGGAVELRRLFSGFTRWKVAPRWYFAAAFLLLGPFAVAAVYIALGHPAVGLIAGMTIPLLLWRVFTQLLAGPASEEAGWRGFALPRLQARFSAFNASLILGVIWTLWHLPLFFIAGEAQLGIPFPFYLLLVVTLSVYFAWLYNNTGGSLIITVFAHFCFNLTGTLITGPLNLMPTMMFYMTASPMLGVATIAVVLYFKPKHLSRKPDSELPDTIPATA